MFSDAKNFFLDLTKQFFLPEEFFSWQKMFSCSKKKKSSGKEKKLVTKSRKERFHHKSFNRFTIKTI